MLAPSWLQTCVGSKLHQLSATCSLWHSSPCSKPPVGVLLFCCSPALLLGHDPLPAQAALQPRGWPRLDVLALLLIRISLPTNWG